MLFLYETEPDYILVNTILYCIVLLYRTLDLIPMCPLFRGSTVLQVTVDLIPMCPLFRGSTVLQGTVDLIQCVLYSEVPLYYKGQ